MAQSMPIERKLIFKAGAIRVTRAQNKDDLELWPGDVVVLDTANSTDTNIAVKASSTSDDIDVYGIALQHIVAGEYGEIQTEGPTSVVTVRADGNTNIAVGDELAMIDGATYTDTTITSTLGFTINSTAVTDSGSNFTAAMAGRYIYKDSATTKYRIVTYTDTDNIVITPAYREATDAASSGKVTAECRAMKATAGKGGAFATSLEAYNTNESAGELSAVLFTASKVDSSAGGGDLLADGSVPLTSNWDVGAYTITGTQFISDIADGTAPFGVTSTTVVPNLNASTLEGNAAAAFAVAAHAMSTHSDEDTYSISTSGTLASGAATITGNSTITGDLTVSGALNWGGATTIEEALTVDELKLDTDGVAPSAAHTMGELAYSQSGNALYISVPTGDTIDLQVNATTEMAIGASVTIINEGSNDRDFRVETNGLAYAIYADGANDCVVVGDNTDISDVDYRLMVGNVAKTLATGQSASLLYVAPTASTTEFSSGTHAYIASAYFAEPDITGGGAACTVASTVYIADAPTEASTNHALYVASGSVGIEGAVIVNEASADLDFRVESNGLQYALAVDGGKDCVVVGDDTDISDVDYRLMVGNVAKTLADNQSASIMYVAPTGATTESGTGATTHGYISTAYFAEPNITHAGTSAITVASTVYIADAPSEGSTNAALYVAAGGANVAGGLIVAGATTFNEASADVDFRVESNGLQYALAVDAGKDCVVIGDDTDISDIDHRLMVGNVAKTLATGQSASILYVAPTASTTEFTSGTHGYIATAYFAEPNITHAGGGTITSAATVYINDAPTEGDTNNNALHVASGSTLLQALACGAITVTGGQVIKASSATEMGYQVTNGALTVGAEGSVEIPYLSTTAAAFDDATGGNLDGCIGINYDSDTGPTSTLEARVEGSWLSVAVAGIEIQGKTVGGSRKRGEQWHDNQILEEGKFVDETICLICGEKMKVGDKIALYANYERTTPDGHKNLHAVYGHAEH